MKRFLVIVGAVAFAAALAIPASAKGGGKPGQFVSGTYAYGQIDRNVQPYWSDADPTNDVWNPTACAWDTDDHFSPHTAYGYLDASQEIANTACFIAVENPPRGFIGGYSIHPYYHFHVDGGPVEVWACFPTQNWCGTPVTVTTTFDGCWRGPTYPQNAPTSIEIPNSNGGWGLPSTWVIHVRNPLAKRSRVFDVWAEGGNDQDFCRPQPYQLSDGNPPIGWALTWQ